ncbi:hypothetical protein NW762_000806 [Fusarium torreyae]|uniref:2EXR domain-containing protein n=1 Tax=Fusarium torreyae TaxID=1237075 RepID=A0A9W8SIL6_9HYPO|nr:hypothetical protein NW762_000806 [Fusarium torreyae]
MSGHDHKPSFASRMIDAILTPFTKIGPLLPKINFSSELTVAISEGPRLLRLRAEVELPAVGAGVADSNLPNFPRFNKLPPEIRMIIWKLSFGPPRIFQTKATSTVPGVVPMVVNHKPPPATQACQEARGISLEVGKFLFGSYGGSFKSLWFNCSADILYWHNIEFQWWKIINNGHQLSCVENVAVDKFDDPGSFQEAHDVSAAFPTCKRLLIVLRCKELADSDVRFFYPKDDEHVIFECMEQPVDWEEVKSDLEQCYEEMEIMNEGEEVPFIDEYELPRFYVVEVAPIRSKAQH